MRFTRLQAIRFGPLSDLDTGGERPLPNFVAVLGPNEAGKSACHGFIAALIQGIYPANRDQNSFAPWGGGDIEVRGELVLDQGESLAIHRKLLSTPRGELVRGGTLETLGNRGLPFAAHVTRGLYEQVYAIDLADLAQVHAEAWNQVRDHLVVGMGSDDLRPPREVARELEERAGRLWRPTKQGKPRHSELEKAKKELRERRRAAIDRDEELRGALEQRARLERELAELQSQRSTLTAALSRLRSLAPQRTRLQRLDRLREEVGEIEPLRALPRDPRMHLLALQERAEGVARDRAVQLRAEGERLEAARPLLGPELNDPGSLGAAAKHFLALPLARLRGAIREWEGAGMRRGEIEEELRELSSRPTPPDPALPLGAIAAGAGGALLLLWGWMRGGTLPWVLAALLVALAVFLVVRFREAGARTQHARTDREAAEEVLRTRLTATESALRGREDEIRSILSPLALAGGATALSFPTLLEEIEKFVAVLRSSPPLSEPVDEASEAQLQAFEEALRRAGGSAESDGLAVVESRLRGWTDLERITAEIEGEAGGVTQLRDRIREAERMGEGWQELPERITAESTRLEGIELRIQELSTASGALSTQVMHLDAGERTDLVDGALEQLEEEMEEVRRERDRLFLLARILDRAEARFREANQPELLRVAERYLARITGGRYAKILTEQGRAANELHLAADHLPAPTPVGAPLSAGTREQVYLALRLAIVDHLDEGRETLPLLLDEVLVNWDSERRGRALDLLGELSTRRQIFLFTCHPHLAEEVRSRGGGIVELPAPRGSQSEVDGG